MENKEELPGSALLRFALLDLEPVSCSSQLSRSRDQESSHSSLSMRVRVGKDREVRTPEGRDLKGAEWTVTFQENGTGNKLTKQHNAIGLLNYYGEYHSEYDDDFSPEGCHAWADVDAETFQLLRQMAMTGQLPSSLRMHVQGMNYGWEPDGSSIEWDIKAREAVVINSLEIFTCLVKSPEQDAQADEFNTFAIPVPAQESLELVAMRGMANAVEQVNARLGWVVALLAVTLAVVIFGG